MFGNMFITWQWITCKWSWKSLWTGRACPECRVASAESPWEGCREIDNQAASRNIVWWWHVTSWRDNNRPGQCSSRRPRSWTALRCRVAARSADTGSTSQASSSRCTAGCGENNVSLAFYYVSGLDYIILENLNDELVYDVWNLFSFYTKSSLF